MSTRRNTGRDAIRISLPNLLDDGDLPHEDAEWRDIVIQPGTLFSWDPTSRGAAWLAAEVEATPLEAANVEVE